MNHFDLPTSNPPNYQQDRPDDLSPSQSSGGFGPPEILRRWQRPRPRSEYSSNSSINDENKRLSMASMDSTASSPRFPEDDITQVSILILYVKAANNGVFKEWKML